MAVSKFASHVDAKENINGLTELFIAYLLTGRRGRSKRSSVL